MTTSDALTASLEDYIEAIFHLVRKKKVARAKDIAKRMGVNNSSVTGALHALSDRGLINYTPYDVVTLTTEGESAARDVVRRHDVLRDFFVRVLSIDAPSAEEAACRMEHALPPGVRERFVRFLEFVDACPRCGDDWLEAFAERCRHGRHPEACEPCIVRALDKTRKETERHE
ncbi:MAG TPA: metal-dependent transcriptional regulator [Planctomycetota bacterium]|nr:metal-dependent transcriptional regulator [Planctomycetota bacterium]HUV40005.1 metal-dependent transcriptional regulator [Planctomycetota bacterium]